MEVLLRLRRWFFVGVAICFAGILGFFFGDFRKVFLMTSQDTLTTAATPEAFAQGSKDIDPGSGGSGSGDPGGGSSGP